MVRQSLAIQLRSVAGPRLLPIKVEVLGLVVILANWAKKHLSNLAGAEQEYLLLYPNMTSDSTTM